MSEYNTIFLRILKNDTIYFNIFTPRSTLNFISSYILALFVLLMGVGSSHSLRGTSIPRNHQLLVAPKLVVGLLNPAPLP